MIRKQLPDGTYVKKVNHLEQSAEENLTDMIAGFFDPAGLTESEIVQICTECLNVADYNLAFDRIARVIAVCLYDITWAREVYKRGEAVINEIDDYTGLAGSVIEYLNDREWGLMLIEQAKTIAYKNQETFGYLNIADAYCEYVRDKIKGKELYLLAEKHATTYDEYDCIAASVLKYLNDYIWFSELVDKAYLLAKGTQEIY
jgi:hypothetical protein